MFAVLGEIVFETLTAPDRLERTLRWSYAEQSVVEDLPRLQWIADDLETIRLEMLFHVFVTNPGAQLAALISAAEDHQARALVFGNGDHRGYFVITELHVIEKQMSDLGDPISVKVQVELKEWALTSETNSTLAPIPSFVPIGIVPAPIGSATGPIAYSAPLSVLGPTNVPREAYIATPLAALGVSPILTNPIPGGASTASATAVDVLPAAIVRSAI